MRYRIDYEYRWRQLTGVRRKRHFPAPGLQKGWKNMRRRVSCTSGYKHECYKLMSRNIRRDWRRFET